MGEILIYTHDSALQQKLCNALKKEKLVGRPADEGTTLTPETVSRISSVLMDARMEWSVCRDLLRMLANAECPIVFLTEDMSMRDHLKALYSGKSSVLPLSFHHHALKTALNEVMSAEPKQRELHLLEEEQAAMLDGRRVPLTAQEYALLCALMADPDSPVSRETLLRTAWGYQSMGETRTVDVHVQRLRKKLGMDTIETVYKCGYRLRLA